MKKILYLLIVTLSLSKCLKAQQLPPVNRTNDPHVLVDRNFMARYFLGIPRGPVPSFPASVPDSLKCKALWLKTTTGQRDTLKHYDCITSHWVTISGGGGTTDTTQYLPLFMSTDKTINTLGNILNIRSSATSGPTVVITSSNTDNDNSSVFAIKNTAGATKATISFNGGFFGNSFSDINGGDFSKVLTADSGTSILRNNPNGYFLQMGDTLQNYYRFDRLGVHMGSAANTNFSMYRDSGFYFTSGTVSAGVSFFHFSPSSISLFRANTAGHISGIGFGSTMIELDAVNNIGFQIDPATIDTSKWAAHPLSLVSSGWVLNRIATYGGGGGGGTTTHALTFGYGFTSISPFDGSSALTAKIDTSSSGLQTILNFFPKADTRYYPKTISDGRYSQLNATNLFTNGFTSQWSSNGVNTSFPNVTVTNTGVTNNFNSSLAVALGSGSLLFTSSTNVGTVVMTPTSSRTVRLPDASMTLAGAVTNANGVSAINSNGSFTISLGAITPTSINGVLAATMAFVDPTSSIQSQLNAKQATGNYISSLTGDATASGPGSAALSFATVNSDVGSFGDATHVPAITVNAKGLATAVTSTAITFPVTPSNSVTFTNKTGNISQWTNDSGYITISPVTSIFGRTGAVVAATNDYTFSQIASKPTTLGGYGITDGLTAALAASTYQPLLSGTGNVFSTAGTITYRTSVRNEVPSGSVNGSNTTFTASHSPISGTAEFYYNGLLLRPTTDYTISGTTITTTFTPTAGSGSGSLLINYSY